MIKLEVRYFAAMRELAGKGKETVETSAATVGALYDELRGTYSFTLLHEQLKASLNGEWVSLEAALHEGDTVVFIPPVAGG